MKRHLLLMALAIVATLNLSAPEMKYSVYAVGFYNLENLFDTCHDEGKNDYEYLPDGAMKWNGIKYTNKLRNMARVLADMGTDVLPKIGCAIIGVSEVENAKVLTDLTAQPALAARGYKFCHVEGEDARGIDCALLYDPVQFNVTSSKLVPSTPFEGDTMHLTRGFLIIEGFLANERIGLIVNHWPSRGAASPVRIHAAQQVKALKDSLLREHKRMKLVIMGDLNDDPMDESLQALGTRKYPKQVKKGELYNPWWATLEDESKGTLLYRGKWNLFDQIIISRTLLKSRRGLRYAGHEIFSRPYLFQQDGQYKGYPLRTHGGRTWLDGYSDHLPTIIYLKKK